MDTFAALALATEPPLPSVIKQTSEESKQILTPTVWRQILGISLWNIIVMGILIFFGQTLGGFSFDSSISPSYHLGSDPDEGDKKLYKES